MGSKAKYDDLGTMPSQISLQNPPLTGLRPPDIGVSGYYRGYKYTSSTN